MPSQSSPQDPCEQSTPFSPAGFRLMDYLNLDWYLNLFRRNGVTSTCLPSPNLGHRPGDDILPTMSLADFFARQGVLPAHHRRSAKLNHNTSRYKARGPFNNSRRRKGKHGVKHLSFGSFHRRAQLLKEKRKLAHRKSLEYHLHCRKWAREGLSRLRKEAYALMVPEQMTIPDQIFLEQLAKLHLDQGWQHGLEGCREQLQHAADESDGRRIEHEKRDTVAAQMRLTGHEVAQEEQRRKVAEFLQAEQEARMARYLRREKSAMRADEVRQRAHEEQERKVREEQERLFREELARKAEEDRRVQEEKERRHQEEVLRMLREARARFFREARERAYRAEQARKAREERERQAREEQERRIREEQERRAREERERLAREEWERQVRFLAEQSHRASQDEQTRQHFAIYEGKWNELRTNNSLGPIDILEMPWPVFGTVHSVDQITLEGVRAFLFHPQRPGVEGKTAREKVKSEVLRFHPDKFNTRIVPKIQMSQQEMAQKISGAVARILTRILAEQEENQK